jgi:uncharacterized membrane protein YhhN
VPALVTAAALVMPATVVGVWLWTPAGREMRPVVVAYIVVISAMVAGAVGAVAAGAPGVIAVAAPLFYVSDLFVARNRFVAPGFVNRLAGLPLYYAAQILFAASTGLV